MLNRNKIALIKFGGHAMDIAELRQAFGRDLFNLRKDGWSFVLVHGGGPHIGKLLERLKLESKFVDGLRVTDDSALAVVEMVLCGQVNKEVTRLLEKASIPAIGISGEDGPILFAKEKNPLLGRVGEISRVDPSLILYLLQGSYLPVIAPLAVDENFEPLNVNADTAAGAIAGALNADFFILLSDVPGVLDREGKLIPRLDWSMIQRMMEDGSIHGGMIPKVQACLNALEMGCKEAIILDGREENSLERYLRGGEALGSLIQKKEI